MGGNEFTTQYTLMNMFKDGGIFMYPLVLCSLFALGVIIAKAYTLYVAQNQSRSILKEVETLARDGQIDQAIQRTRATPGPVAAVLLAGLRRIRDRDFSTPDVEKALRTTGTIELGFVERGLPVLATVSNVAPLLGFLGTVAGMISAFGAIAEAGQVEASLVAGGIKIALITTATGLLIAVPINIAYNFFVTRIDKLIVEMEEGSAQVLNLLWDLSPRLELAGVGSAGASQLQRGAQLREPTQSVEGMDNPDPGAVGGKGTLNP